MSLFSLMLPRTWQPGEIPDDWKRGECHPALQKEQDRRTGELQGSWTLPCMGQTLLEATSWHRKGKRVLRNTRHKMTNSKSCDRPEWSFRWDVWLCGGKESSGVEVLWGGLVWGFFCGGRLLGFFLFWGFGVELDFFVFFWGFLFCLGIVWVCLP